MKNSLIKKFLEMLASVFKRDDAPNPQRKYKKKVVDKTKREFPEPAYKVKPEELPDVALNIEIESREKAVESREKELAVSIKTLKNAKTEDAEVAAKATLKTAEEALKIAKTRLKESKVKAGDTANMTGNMQGDLDDNTSSSSTLTTGRYTAEDKAIVAKATEGYGLEEVNFEKLAATLNRDIKAVKQRVRKQYK